MQCKTLKEIRAIFTETLCEHAPSYATVKNLVAQFKRVDFSTCVARRRGRLKNSDQPGDYWTNSWAILWRPPDFV